MPERIFENVTYENQDFARNPAEPGVYESCRFISCNLSGYILKDFKLIDCIFESSNLSNADLTHTLIQSCEFRKCKMIGLGFDKCNTMMLSFTFESCMLNLSSFFQLKIPGTRFKDCNLQEVDFTGSDLSKSLFQGTDLYGAIFENTLLEEADLRTAVNYSINPEINYIRKAKFSLEGLTGLLDKYEIQID